MHPFDPLSGVDQASRQATSRGHAAARLDPAHGPKRGSLPIETLLSPLLPLTPLAASVCPFYPRFIPVCISDQGLRFARLRNCNPAGQMPGRPVQIQCGTCRRLLVHVPQAAREQLRSGQFRLRPERSNGRPAVLATKSRLSVRRKKLDRRFQIPKTRLRSASPTPHREMLSFRP